MNNETQQYDVYQWMKSNRIYEGYLFGYITVLVICIIGGSELIGFEIDGYSQKENLAFNFYYFIFLAVVTAILPHVYRLFKDKSASIEQRREEIIEASQSINDEVFRQNIIEYLEHDGGLPPNKLQIWALICIAWYYLFELFFIGAWVKDLSLVWQPEWIDALIAWTKDNTVITPYFTMEGFFNLSFGGHGDSEGETIIAQMFQGDEQAFLDSTFGDVAIVFHFIKATGFFWLLTGWIIVSWQLLGWTGMNNLDTSEIKTIKSFLWLSFISFFMVLMLVAAFVASVTDLTFMAGGAMGHYYWVKDFWMNISIFFAIVGIRLTVGWLFFWKNLFVKLIIRIKA